MPDWKEEVRQAPVATQPEPVHEAEIVEELAQHLDDVYERSLKAGQLKRKQKEQHLKNSPIPI